MKAGLKETLTMSAILFDTFHIKATFFTLGWIAEVNPDVIQRIASKGHEIASAGYGIRTLGEMTRDQFRDDILRAQKALESAGANKIIGFRCSHKWLTEQNLWALEVLAEEGYAYDASYRTPLWSFGNHTPYRFIHKRQVNGKEIWEIPVSTYSIAGFSVPISGGNYLRQFPHWLMMRAFQSWCRKTESPFIIYFHPWELDPDLPRIDSVSFLAKNKTIQKSWAHVGTIACLLRARPIPEHQPVPGYTFGTGRADNRSWASGSTSAAIASTHEQGDRVSADEKKQEVSVVIPVYNEAASLPYLKRALDELINQSDIYALKFIFVDDGSKDNTYQVLCDSFNSRNDCTIIRHQSNKGIAEALRTGIVSANTDIVCSMDADCSYDPLELLNMIPMLEEGVDMVTASPYHNVGSVRNVPKWRLFLSKSLSKLYHVTLHNKLATYTSCFRVYRRDSVSKIPPGYSGFLGVLELLAKLDINGGKVVEYPTVLQCRIFGHSKMQVARNIVGHLKLLGTIIDYRWRFEKHHHKPLAS